jgi:uncharacterized membrane protein (DUF2068 family)
MQQRPTGITILAIAYFVGGGISFVASCLALAMSERLRADDETADDTSPVLELNIAWRRNPVFWIGLVGASISLFKLLAAAGLWTVQPWGRRLALVSGTVNLVTHLGGAIGGAGSPSGVVGLLVNSVVLVYLSRPHVRQALSSVSIDATATTP